MHGHMHACTLSHYAEVFAAVFLLELVKQNKSQYVGPVADILKHWKLPVTTNPECFL